MLSLYEIQRVSMNLFLFFEHLIESYLRHIAGGRMSRSDNYNFTKEPRRRLGRMEGVFFVVVYCWNNLFVSVYNEKGSSFNIMLLGRKTKGHLRCRVEEAKCKHFPFHRSFSFSYLNQHD